MITSPPWRIQWGLWYSYCLTWVSLFYFIHFIIPFRKFTCLGYHTWVKQQQPQEQCYPVGVLHPSALWVASCFCCPANSDTDCRIFNMHTISFLCRCVHIHTGVGYTDKSAHHFWVKNLQIIFFCSWWGSNIWSLDLESDALPIESPPSQLCCGFLVLCVTGLGGLGWGGQCVCWLVTDCDCCYRGWHAGLCDHGAGPSGGHHQSLQHAKDSAGEHRWVARPTPVRLSGLKLRKTSHGPVAPPPVGLKAFSERSKLPVPLKLIASQLKWSDSPQIFLL